MSSMASMLEGRGHRGKKGDRGGAEKQKEKGRGGGQTGKHAEIH